ncbi:MMPL family transporter [Sphaerotilus uruguayifluvii]|uniref:Exporter n=1 Tax=Sphaerotilus uruguayifluvii TaxID=2735897 RepID=A0ABX2G917_9BURK|nr:transporter [Leptothrix sp. C29]NRT57942.1 putative exporter [Leptothrix sp. C29]
MRRAAAWTLAIWLALMALAGLVAARASYVADLSAFLPSAPTPGQRVLMEQLRNGATARVLLIGVRGGEPAARAEASRRLAARLRQSGAFDAVHNGETGGPEQQALGRLLFERRYLLSPAVDAARFQPEGLRAGIDETLSLLGTPAGAMIKPILMRDPTGETVRMAEAMLPAVAPRVEDGVWVSRREPRALLVATTRADGDDLDAQAAAQQQVRAAFAAVAPQAGPGLQLELSGPGVFAVESRTLIHAEVDRLAKAGGAVMLVLLLIAFGRPQALLLAALPVGAGVLAGIVAVDLLTGTVHGLTLGFGTTLIGEAVDYGIYYLIQARALGAAGWRRQHWPTVRLGLLTSLAGFAALAFSGFAGLVQLGLFSISGLVAATLTTRFVLPVLAPQGSPGLGLRGPLGRATGRLAGALPRLARPLALLAAGAALWLALQPSPWRGTLAALSPVPAEAMALDASLREDLGAAEAGVLVAIEAPDEAQALQRAEQAGARLEALVQAGVLAGYDSPAQRLPSPSTQLARRAALPEAAALRQALAQATAGGPLPAGSLQAFVDDVQAQRRAPVLTRAGLAGTPLASALDAQLVAPRQAGAPWTALLSLRMTPAAAADPAAAARLDRALAGLPDTRVVRIQPELDAIYAGYLTQARWQAGLGALAVVALLAWHLRSGRRLARVLWPLAASGVLVLAGLTASGQPLGVLHLVGLLLVVAVGSNYALFFDHLAATSGTAPADGDDAQAGADLLASLLMANLTTVASFGLLATAQVPALAAVGQTVAPGALLALLLSAAFIRQPRRAAAV